MKEEKMKILCYKKMSEKESWKYISKKALSYFIRVHIVEIVSELTLIVNVWTTW